MNSIKISFHLALLFIMVVSCSKEISIPVETCSENSILFNMNHPKADAVQEIMEKYIKLGYPGLTVLIATPKDGKWIGSTGVSRIENQQPMANCNIYHSASVAKTYHAVAAMTLVEEQRLDLDATIDTYLPDWICSSLPNRNTATVRQLMNHTSGIPDFIGKMDHMLDYFQNLQRQFTTKEYIGYLCGNDADFQAGTSVSYSNSNTVLLALLMDQITGSHADLISDRIINKLDLQHTYYKNENGYPAPEGTVNTYLDIKGNGVMVNSSEYERNFAQMNIGHDGMLATANDYYLFLNGLFSGELVSSESLAEMIKYEPMNSPVQRGEGLGLEITVAPLGVLTRIGHNGGSLGAANNVFYYPEQNTYIVTCSNYGDFIDGPLSTYNWSALIGHQANLLGELEILLFGI